MAGSQALAGRPRAVNKTCMRRTLRQRREYLVKLSNDKILAFLKVAEVSSAGHVAHQLTRAGSELASQNGSPI
jgi:hypothetical protein